LTGKYRREEKPPAGTRMAIMPHVAARYLTDTNWDRVERLAAFCAARGRGLLDLAFSWLLHRPMVASVIAGATSPEQVAANVKAAEWSLSREDMDEIDRITAN
jgi:aryl-alcohol dehydrogenase-like predicted oxidoreductase